MKYIKTFEQFINESITNESTKTIRTKKDFEADIKETQEELRKNGERVSLSQAKKIVLATYKDNNVVVENLESEINEQVSKLQKYVEDGSKRVERGGGNYVNITDYGTAELAGLIDIYHIDTPDGIYSDKTVKLFKQLIDSMCDDEIENNQDTHESVNTSNTKGINEGHDGEIGPTDAQTKDAAIKELEDMIKFAKENDGDLKKFRGVKWVGNTTEDKLDRLSMQHEDDYIVAGIVDGEIWMARSCRS